jgi:ATP-binding cassette subfamily B protein
MFHSGGWFARLQYDDTQRPTVDRSLLRRVFSYASPYRWHLAGVAATIVVISILNVLPPVLVRALIDEAIPNEDLRQLTVLGGLMVAVPLVAAGVGGFQRWLSATVGEGIIFDLRTAAFAHLQRMSLRFYTSTRTGELISRLNSDVVGAQQAVTGTFVTIASNLVAVVTVLVVMIGTDWRLTLLAVAALPLFVLPARAVARVLRQITRQQMEHDAAMSAILQETFNVSGALLVKLFGRAPEEQDRYGVEADAVRRLGVRRALVGRWLFAGLGLISAIGSASVFWVGGWMVINDLITIGDVVMFSTLTAQLYGPLSSLTNARVEFATSLVSFERVFEVLDLGVEITDPADPVDAMIRGGVAFDGVWFRYDTEDPVGLEAVRRFSHRQGASTVEGLVQTVSGREWALSDITFGVEPGSMVALVGPSGAGKTTVSYLVPRLYDVDRGRVLLDGIDVRSFRLEDLAEAIGVVTQEAYLFHDTIAANLRYARPDATDDELVAASEAANIHSFIESLPDGYQTVVGERGHRLSGGEKARVALARVILKDPAILVLDEATAHLDSQSEALIQEALEHVLAGRTSIVIAHRLSTVRAADLILVIDEGRLVERGSHEELLAAGGLYAELYATQFGGVSAPT